MAIVDRSGKVRGAISNLVYRSYRSLNIIQSKPAKVKQTIASKESGLEFGLCSNAACEMRKAFTPAYSGYDGAMINRFTGLVRKGLQACTTKERGYRDMHDADLSFLEGFQFNANSPLDRVLKVRPVASLEENTIRVSLPAFSVRRDIKWPPNAVKCTLRIVAISFDFRKKVFSYLGCKETVLKQTDSYAAQEWLIQEPLPQGRIVLLSMSLHAYSNFYFDNQVSLNSRELSPAEIIGAWHIPEDEEQPEIQRDNRGQSPILSGNDEPMAYLGDDMLAKIIELQEKNAGKIKPMVKAKPVAGLNLPSGDIGF